MKNAHLRIGKMTFARTIGKAITSFSLHMDRFIGERLSQDLPQAHFLSVFGGDAEIAAASAIISGQENFEVEGPDIEGMRVNMGKNAESYRASLQLTSRKRPLRHLIAVSEEFHAQVNASTSGRTLLAHSAPEYVWASLAQMFGLPAVPEWSAWFHTKLLDNLAVTPLYGLGCLPVLITGTKEEYLGWLSAGIRNGDIQFPEQNGPSVWPTSTLNSIFHPGEAPPAASQFIH